jgi:hypothetical protein
VGCDRLPPGIHGKEGVDGSSPSEGSAKAAEIAAFSISLACISSSMRWVWSRLWSFQVHDPSVQPHLARLGRPPVLRQRPLNPSTKLVPCGSRRLRVNLFSELYGDALKGVVGAPAEEETCPRRCCARGRDGLLRRQEASESCRARGLSGRAPRRARAAGPTGIGLGRCRAGHRRAQEGR